MASRSGHGMLSRSGILARSGVRTMAPVFVAERDAVDLVQAVRAARRQLRQQLRQRQLALADDDDVGAGAEILRSGSWRSPGRPSTTVHRCCFAARTISSTERRVMRLV